MVLKHIKKPKKHCLKTIILKCARKDAMMKKYKDACKRLNDLNDFKGHSNIRIPGNLVKQSNKNKAQQKTNIREAKIQT